ncbi:MAG: hypothetical protein KDA73_10445 [Rhodobacteraceae bacterium]|nr:hypothetical protein [Paracoccaceae bacterium]
MEALFAILIGVLMLFVVYKLYIGIPMDMARARNRSDTTWVIISILLSPVLAIFLLLVLGQAAPRARDGCGR